MSSGKWVPVRAKERTSSNDDIQNISPPSQRRKVIAVDNHKKKNPCVTARVADGTWSYEGGKLEPRDSLRGPLHVSASLLAEKETKIASAG